MPTDLKKEPVVYVRRQYLDYDDQVIDQKDPFVESLTHDSIIVQIPHLKGRTRNRLERLLKAGVAPDVRREMDIEDEILSEIEKRDTVIMQREQMIEQNNKMLQEAVCMLTKAGISIEEIAQRLSLSIQEVQSLM